MNENPPIRRSEDPGETMNVRRVHAAIWREQSEPRELVRRMPTVLKHFYFIMFVWLVFYLVSWMGPLDWNEYEQDPVQRVERDAARLKASERPSP
jgi:hypothetical protein